MCIRDRGHSEWKEWQFCNLCCIFLSHIAMVIVIVTDFLAFVLMHTQKNESQEYQFFGGEFWRKIGVCVYTFLYVQEYQFFGGEFWRKIGVCVYTFLYVKIGVCVYTFLYVKIGVRVYTFLYVKIGVCVYTFLYVKKMGNRWKTT